MKKSKLGCLGIIGILLIIGAIISFFDGIGKPKIPDVTGMKVSEAQDTLKDAGFTNIKLKGKYGEDAAKAKDWTVTDQDPSADTKAAEDDKLTLTCLSPEMAEIEKTQKEAKKQEEKKKEALNKKVDLTSAWVAAEQYGEAQYPYGFDLHSAFGVLAEEPSDENTWYLKASCDVTNQYGAEAEMVCEAYVTGTTDSPTVVNFIVY